MAGLTWIDLRDNALARLPEQVLAHPDTLIKVNLTGNPFTADSASDLTAALHRIETAQGLPAGTLQRFAQAAVAAGHPASCVNIVTMSSHCGQSFLAGYAASKAALANITKNSANALRAHRIRVNGVNVGWMDTPGEDAIQRQFHGAGDDWLAKAEAAQPFGMLVKPGHVAGLVSYLLSPESGVMTGAMVDFDQNVNGAYGE